MPYIRQERRDQLDTYILALSERLQFLGNDEGDLNYVITQLLRFQFNGNRRYSTGNRLLGVLQCVTQEFYRRWLGPYEDEAIAKNGELKCP